MAVAQSCFHCGLPVLEPGRHAAIVLGERREMCCAGCAAVAATISAAGLDSYYRTRTEAALPVLPEERPQLPAAGPRNEASLILERVTCSACLWLIEQVLLRSEGVVRAQVNFATRRAHVAWDPVRTSLAAVIQAVRDVGYGACPYEPARADALERREHRTSLWRLFVAGLGAMQVMMYAFPAYVDTGLPGTQAAQLMRWASLVITLPVLAFSCRPFFAGAWRELRQGRLGLETPLALGLGGGFLASAWATAAASGEVYFDSVCMLAFVLLAVRHIESAARSRARRLLDRLLSFAADKGAQVGERIVVSPGERIPADGIVETGSSCADESLLTGESRPVPKRPGDELVAGSVNLDQPLAFRVTRTGAGTRAAEIARLAERAASSRPPLIETSDRVARALTGLVILVALAAAAYQRDPWVAVAVLVATCPCALALAAPIVLMRANAELLSRGVLVTRSAALQALAALTDLVFDKTGTLTEGKLALVRVACCGEPGEARCRTLAASLEAASRHPIARALCGAAQLPVERPRYAAGLGIEGWIGGQVYRIGSAEFCGELCRGEPPAAAAAQAGRIYLAGAQGWLAAFDLQDALRADAAAAVRDMKLRRLHLHLLSGDAPSAASAVARAAGIERSSGGVLPGGKLRYVRALQREGRVVAMVGDGVNDAPVLAGADASFAMGAGASAAQLQADIVLLNDSLAGLHVTLDAARAAMARIRQNVAWALAYNALALPVAAAGWIGPWEAALGMGASSVIVFVNALRPLIGHDSWKASTSSYPSPSLSYS